MKKESLNKAPLKKVIAVSAVLALMIWIATDPTMAKIVNEEIKAASQTWTATIKDWSTTVSMPIMCGGMVLAAIMFFINKYAYVLDAIGGTGPMYTQCVRREVIRRKWYWVHCRYGEVVVRHRVNAEEEPWQSCITMWYWDT